MAGAEVRADVQYGFWANMYAIQYISLRFYKEMLKKTIMSMFIPDAYSLLRNI